MMIGKTAAGEGRWALYRLLADPGRLRLLALVTEEELSVGELTELLGDSQPNVSRQATSLRQGGLVSDRRQGTRTFVRVAEGALVDPVVCDAIGEGRRLCREEGRLERIAVVVRQRDARAREYFEAGEREQSDIRLAAELPAYAFAVAKLTTERGVAVDAGTGDGAMLDVLAPFFQKVIAIDRSPLQLKRAETRILQRGYDNVELLCGEIDDREIRRSVGEGADAVFATRLLHHAASPRVTMAALVALLRPGGELVVIDYQPHENEAFREQRADVWMGFAEDELRQLATLAGLSGSAWFEVPKGFVGGGVDGHLPWQVLRSMRPTATP
jgi:DNA-binding transcriptional ArsR family regulator/protein-L-isoaspartate O-methyltransferase